VRHLSNQTGALAETFVKEEWNERTQRHQRAQIRERFGFQLFHAEDEVDFLAWLMEHVVSPNPNSVNRLTGRPTYPNPRDVIDAVARKGKVRVVVDGLTAANDLGLTDAVPARIAMLSDGRLRPITLGNLILDFQAAAPSRLYWAGRPAMRFNVSLDCSALGLRIVHFRTLPPNSERVSSATSFGVAELPRKVRRF
jgi:hypothetical protein